MTSTASIAHGIFLKVVFYTCRHSIRYALDRGTTHISTRILEADRMKPNMSRSNFSPLVSKTLARSFYDMACFGTSSDIKSSSIGLCALFQPRLTSQQAASSTWAGLHCPSCRPICRKWDIRGRRYRCHRHCECLLHDLIQAGGDASPQKDARAHLEIQELIRYLGSVQLFRKKGAKKYTNSF